jgi:hypothetical protein
MPVFLFSVLFVFVLIVLVFVILVVIEVVIVAAGVPFRFQFNRINAGDGQRSSTLIARQDIPFIKFFFFNIDSRIAFGATDHKTNLSEAKNYALTGI